MSKTKAERLAAMEERLNKLSNKRERNIDRYIIPIELKMSMLRERIEKLSGKEFLKY